MRNEVPGLVDAVPPLAAASESVRLASEKLSAMGHCPYSTPARSRGCERAGEGHLAGLSWGEEGRGGGAVLTAMWGWLK